MLIAAASFWGAHWVVARAIVPHVTPTSMSFWRWVIAIAVLAPFAWPMLVRDRAKLLAAWKVILFFGTTGTVLYNAVGYLGLRHTTATNALLFQSFTPVLIPLIAYALFRERITAWTAAGLAVSLCGVLAIVFRLDAAALAAFRFNPGDLWLLGNICLWALYTACLRWAPRDVDPMALLLAVMLAGMVTGLPAWLIEQAAGGGVAWSAGVFWGLAYLGAFPSVVCFLLWSKGVAAIGPSKAGAYLHVTPVSGIAMAALILGERVELHHAVGFALILGGVWLATRRR
jgi:drug/metabolite transporter (DMT)-like permease